MHFIHCFRFVNEFDQISERANRKPKTTEELVALGNYMMYMKTVYVKKKWIVIRSFIQNHWKIISLFHMSKQFNQLVPKAINLYLGLEDIFDNFADVGTKNID